MESLELLSANPEKITEVISKAGASAIMIPSIRELNWTLIISSNPGVLKDLFVLNTHILASNSPVNIKQFLIVLLKSIFE